MTPVENRIASPQAAAWYDGPIVYSTILNCFSIIDGSPYQENGAGVFTGFAADPSYGQPYPGQVYYTRIVIYGLGNACSGMYAWPELRLPANTGLAISGLNPVRCLYDGTYDPGLACPQTLTESIFHYGSYAIPSPSTPEYGNTWPIPQGHYLEIQVPVVSSASISNSDMTAYIHMIDGNDNPWLEAHRGVYVFSGDPMVLYPNPSSGAITATTAEVYSYVYTYGQGGTYYFDSGLDTSYGYTYSEYFPPEDIGYFITLSTYDLVPDTLYHWRVRFVANNGQTAVGVDQTFRTLPDGRMTVGNGIAASCTEAALNSALATAKSITFNCGILPVTISLTTPKSITSDLVIDGDGKITLSGNNAVKHFTVQADATLTLNNLALINGKSTAECGGAIRVLERGEVILEGSRLLDNNSTTRGGAVCVDPLGNATLLHTLVSQNSASWVGGGLYNAGGLYVFWSEISLNVSGEGGGISNDGELHMGYDLVYKNSTSKLTMVAKEWGGGLVNHGYADVYISTFAENFAHNGGGIYSDGYFLYLAGDTITANKAATDSTSDPHYYSYGGGLASTSNSAVVTLRNTMLTKNKPGNCDTDDTRRYWTSAGYNLDSADRCVLRAAGDLVNVDPLLGSLADNGGPTRTYALTPASPAIDSGTNTDCGPYDQRGLSGPIQPGPLRQVDGDGNGEATCDIGAYEARPTVFLPLILR